MAKSSISISQWLDDNDAVLRAAGVLPKSLQPRKTRTVQKVEREHTIEEYERIGGFDGEAPHRHNKSRHN